MMKTFCPSVFDFAKTLAFDLAILKEDRHKTDESNASRSTTYGKYGQEGDAILLWLEINAKAANQKLGLDENNPRSFENLAKCVVENAIKQQLYFQYDAKSVGEFFQNFKDKVIQPALEATPTIATQPPSGGAGQQSPSRPLLQKGHLTLVRSNERPPEG